MRRSVPLHYTDYGYGDHPVKLAFHRTLFEWIPYFKEVTLSWDLRAAARFDHRVDSYLLPLRPGAHADSPRSTSAGTITTSRSRRGDRHLAPGGRPDAVRRLLPAHADTTARRGNGWRGSSTARRTGRGFIQAIRLPAAPEETTRRASARRLDADADRTSSRTRRPARRAGDVRGESSDPRRLHLWLAQRAGVIWFYSTA